MKIEHIIIQAGGLGTRLGKLTHNKPKSLVPVNNRPLLFHIFERYPNAHFVVIGDYKYTVLENYLKTFAQVNYNLVQAVGKGNAAGVNAALEHIPTGFPVLLLWSDILLEENVNFNNLPEGNYAGITTKYPCSWCMDDGTLQKIPGGKKGLAGLFLFIDKSFLSTLPDEGSFALWLQESKMEIKPFDVLDSNEAGTLDAIRAIDSGINRCRPYNSMEFSSGFVKKTALTAEGQRLLDREIVWYHKMREYGFSSIPVIHSSTPLVMSRINGENIFRTDLNEEEKKQTINKLVDALNLMHGYENRNADIESLNIEYYGKTLARLDSIKTAIPFSDKKHIVINGKPCRNVLFFREEFHKLVEGRLFDAEFAPIHGDATLTNTLIDDKKNIYFIDARGYFGNNEIYGDKYYDWAKLYYSINGNFDNFNIKKFDLEISENEIQYKIESNGWEFLTDYLLNLIPDCNIDKIKLIHAIIWLSLASHCWEDFDSLCTAFYNGTYLLEECWNGTC